MKKINLAHIKNFKELLGEIKGSHELDSSIHTLKIYCLNSELTKEELFYQIKILYGESTKFIDDFSVTKLTSKSPEDEITFYSYKDPKNPVIFILSITGKSKIDLAVDKLIKGLPKTYYLWMPLSIFDKLKEEIIDLYDKEEVRIDSFSGIRKKHYGLSCDLRPHIERKMLYEGPDGLEVLREVNKLYGVLPRKIGFIINSKIQFSVDHRNTFIIKKGFPYLGYILNIINLSLEKYSGIQKVLEEVRLEEIEKEGFIDFNVKPLKLSFSSEKTREDLITFFKLLEADEHGEGRYCILDPLIVEGSLYFSAMVLDSNKESLFSISGDKNEINILPYSNCGKDSLSRFYEQIDTNLDVNTSISKHGTKL